MGGDRKQFQVLVDPNLMLKFGVTIHEVEAALSMSNANATGGYLDEQGPNEFLVRALGRIKSIDDLEQIVVTVTRRPIHRARTNGRVVEGAQIKRGDSAVYVRKADTQRWPGPTTEQPIVRRWTRHRTDDHQATGSRHSRSHRQD